MICFREKDGNGIVSKRHPPSKQFTKSKIQVVDFDSDDIKDDIKDEDFNVKPNRRRKSIPFKIRQARKNKGCKRIGDKTVEGCEGEMSNAATTTRRKRAARGGKKSELTDSGTRVKKARVPCGKNTHLPNVAGDVKVAETASGGHPSIALAPETSALPCCIRNSSGTCGSSMFLLHPFIDSSNMPISSSMPTVLSQRVASLHDDHMKQLSAVDYNLGTQLESGGGGSATVSEHGAFKHHIPGTPVPFSQHPNVSNYSTVEASSAQVFHNNPQVSQYNVLNDHLLPSSITPTAICSAVSLNADAGFPWLQMCDTATPVEKNVHHVQMTRSFTTASVALDVKKLCSPVCSTVLSSVDESISSECILANSMASVPLPSPVDARQAVSSRFPVPATGLSDRLLSPGDKGDEQQADFHLSGSGSGKSAVCQIPLEHNFPPPPALSPVKLAPNVMRRFPPNLTLTAPLLVAGCQFSSSSNETEDDPVKVSTCCLGWAHLSMCVSAMSTERVYRCCSSINVWLLVRWKSGHWAFQ